MPCCCRTAFASRRTRRRRDWTDELLARFASSIASSPTPRGGDQVNLQGIVFDTNEGGRLPLEKYLAATLAEREALAAGAKTIEAVAAQSAG